MTQKKGNRWYDSYPPLRELLDTIKKLRKIEKKVILNGLKEIVTALEPGLIDKTVMEYPMTFKRRWYDSDPTAWLAINGLSCAQQSTVKKAISYLKGVFK